MGVSNFDPYSFVCWCLVLPFCGRLLNKPIAVFDGVFVHTQEQQQNELRLRNWQCKNFLKYLQPDLSWLESHDLTEYSLFVEVAGNSVGCSGLPKVPLCNACLEDTTTLATSLQILLEMINDWQIGVCLQMGYADVCCIPPRKFSMRKIWDNDHWLAVFFPQIQAPGQTVVCPWLGLRLDREKHRWPKLQRLVLCFVDLLSAKSYFHIHIHIYIYIYVYIINFTAHTHPAVMFTCPLAWGHRRLL